MKFILKIMMVSLLGIALVSTGGCKKRGGKTGLPDDGIINGSTNFGGAGEGQLELENIGFGTPLGEFNPDNVDFLDDANSTFSPVYFAYDSSAITGSEQAKVEAIADFMNNDPKAGVVIEGHTDERGDNDYNMSLGERRSLGVREYLMGIGVSADRVHSRSFGEEMPADVGHTESAYRANRRAVFLLFHPKS